MKTARWEVGRKGRWESWVSKTDEANSSYWNCSHFPWSSNLARHPISWGIMWFTIFVFWNKAFLDTWSHYSAHLCHCSETVKTMMGHNIWNSNTEFISNDFSFLLCWTAAKTSQSNEHCTALNKGLQDTHPTALKCFGVKTPAWFKGSSMAVCRRQPALGNEVYYLFPGNSAGEPLPQGVIFIPKTSLLMDFSQESTLKLSFHLPGHVIGVTVSAVISKITQFLSE